MEKFTKKTIVRTCQKLAAMRCPWYDFGGEGNFASTAMEMAVFLNRPLRRVERRALWLSRFSHVLQSQAALNRGYFLNWSELAERLTLTPTPTPTPILTLTPTPVIETRRRAR
jgi:hypothetical protein